MGLLGLGKGEDTDPDPQAATGFTELPPPQTRVSCTMLCRPSPYLPVPPHQDFTCLSSSSCHWASLTPSSLELAPSLSGQHWTPSWPAPTACVAPPPPHCSVPWRWRSASCPAHSSPPPAGPPCQQQGLVDSPGGGGGVTWLWHNTLGPQGKGFLCVLLKKTAPMQRIVCCLQRAASSVQCAGFIVQRATM